MDVMDSKSYFRSSSIGNNNNISLTTLTTTTTNTTPATNELFACFTSRLSSSSSSMKLTKSLLSPARSAASRDGGGGATLSSSLSRRLRPNGSLKSGHASPFFGKRKGCAFENPEPSSPKVTCIGQVRVKSKKKKAKGHQPSRSLSKREVSFRKIESSDNNSSNHHHHHQDGLQQSCGNTNNNGSAAHYVNQECLSHKNQRWVHLPVSICEALRDFSCLFPCGGSSSSSSSKGSCFGKEKCYNEKETTIDKNGCGAVFTRWLVSVNDGENGKRREIELVVGGGDGDDDNERVVETTSARVSMRSSRRHVFEDIEVKDDVIEVKGKSFEEEEDGEVSEARVSICIPPKNALLLMRCRSDPVKMAALVHRFSWDAAACDIDDKDLDNEEAVEEKADENVEMVGSDGKDEVLERDVGVLVVEEQEILDSVEGMPDSKDGDVDLDEGIQLEQLVLSRNDEEDFNEEVDRVNVKDFVEGKKEEEEEVESNMSSFEALLDQENAVEQYEDCRIQDKEEVDEELSAHNSSCSSSSSTESEDEEDGTETDSSPVMSPVIEDEKVGSGESCWGDKVTTFTYDIEHNPEPESTIEESDDKDDQEEEEEEEKSHCPEKFSNKEEQELKKEKETSPALPECLLLMMCEPKLSMEISKETWVCSTDFLRWLPERGSQKPAKSSNYCCHQQHPNKPINNNYIPQPPLADAKEQKEETTLLSKEQSRDVKLLSMEAKSLLKDQVRDRSQSLLKEQVGDRSRSLLKDQVQDRSRSLLKGQVRAGEKPRSSCTLPVAAAASMAKMIEHKLVNAVGYEPFVLTRCKSEPMRTAASKLMPHDSCFWKNAARKMEPHRRAAPPLGVGATGVGF